jgi:hypothetical protein
MLGMFILVPRHRSAAMSSFIQSYLLLTRPRTHPEEQQLIDSYRSKFMTWGGAGFAGGALVGWSLISLSSSFIVYHHRVCVVPLLIERLQ